MRTRPLGRTGISVSVVGFGGSSLGGVFRPVSQAEADATVRAALGAGITYFDTAPYYGWTKAETALGHALGGVARERYVLATKVGRYGHDDFDFSAARVTASVDESLARLGCGHIDVIQVHDLEFVPLAQIWEETLPALMRLRESGKVRAIGITGLPLKALRTVWEHARGSIDVVLSYCRATLQNETFLPWARELRASGVGVINAAPLSMGLLTQGGPPAWHPARGDVRAECRRAAEFCATRGKDLADVALGYALALEEVDCTVLGLASVEEVKRAVSAVERPVDEKMLSGVREILAPVHNVGWSTGRPENN
jgi:L-galactose dehydrogenase